LLICTPNVGAKDAQQVFNMVLTNDVVSWTAVLGEMQQMAMGRKVLHVWKNAHISFACLHLQDGAQILWLVQAWPGKFVTFFHPDLQQVLCIF
jgi:hypothetical protein